MSHKILILSSYREGDFCDGYAAGMALAGQKNITLAADLVLGASETAMLYVATLPPKHKLLDAIIAHDGLGTGVTAALAVVDAPDLSSNPARDTAIASTEVTITSANTLIAAASAATAGRLTNNTNTGFRIGIARDNSYKTLGLKIGAPGGGITIPAGTVISYLQNYRVASDGSEA